MPLVYRSPIPDVYIPEHSIFTHVFSSKFDPQLPAYIDPSSGHTLSRGDVYARCLQLAWGLQNILKQAIGSTMAILSPNSIEWPLAVLGGIAAGLRVTTINSAYTPTELRHQLEVHSFHRVVWSVLMLAIVVGQRGVSCICSSEPIGLYQSRP
jgi:4-coumarate--CoA ligase